VEKKILFFAKVKEIVGLPQLTIEINPGTNVMELKRLLCQKYPELIVMMETVIVSDNQEFVFDADVISETGEIAIFPPVSGGAGERDFLQITFNALDINALLSEMTENTTGAAAIFTGIIRGETNKETKTETVGLEYEAYQPMAELKLKQIADEIRNLWPSIERIALVQRIGYMDAGTPTVVVICTAAHRDTGVFEAAKYGINRLKEIVPIWKKEIGPNGESWVDGDYSPQKGD